MANWLTEDDGAFFRRAVVIWLLGLTVGMFGTMYLVLRFDKDQHRHNMEAIADAGTLGRRATDADARIQALEKKIAALEAQQKQAPPAKP